VPAADVLDHAQHHPQPRAFQLQQLAAEQVERLDAGGALVERGDARVAGELLHAPLAM
jgi:hypothetical protein